MVWPNASEERSRWHKRWDIRHCCHRPGVVRLAHMRTVLMVLFDEVQSLDVTGPLEVFTGAWTAYPS